MHFYLHLLPRSDLSCLPPCGDPSRPRPHPLWPRERRRRQWWFLSPSFRSLSHICMNFLKPLSSPPPLPSLRISRFSRSPLRFLPSLSFLVFPPPPPPPPFRCSEYHSAGAPKRLTGLGGSERAGSGWESGHLDTKPSHL